jgi:helix-hairpin-helix protein
VSHNLRHRDAVTGTDDLTRFEAIGPRRAERLNAADIRTYAGLASCSRDEIAAVLPDVSPAKIDAWRDEARELALASSTQEARDVPAPDTLAGPEAPAGPGESVGNGQRYESVLIRIVLNEDGTVRRVTAQHIRTGAESHWPTPEREALPDFIEAAIASAGPSAKAPAEPPPDRAQQAEAAVNEPQPAPDRGTPAQARRARRPSSAVLSVSRTPLRAAEPFTMTLTIDLTGPASHGDRLAYSAVIVARPMTGGPKRTVAESAGLMATTSSTISVDAAGLPPGAYRLDGAVSLREPGRDRPVALAALAEGLLVQVLPG